MIDRNGNALLEYSKPRGTFDAPTAGTNRTVATFATANCSVTVALTLGFDYLFPETVRAVMPLGVQLVLNSVSVALSDTDIKHIHVLAYDNRVFLATANYAAAQRDDALHKKIASQNVSRQSTSSDSVAGAPSAQSLEDVPNGRSGLTSDLTAVRPLGGSTLAGSAPGVFVCVHFFLLLSFYSF